MHYYNEYHPPAAAMLQAMIDEKIIPAGKVDTRSILDVKAADLKGFTQCHFFAGIGGWPLALAAAGWDPRRPVWTGSCPCQPFSAAGRQKGEADERHLWPAFHALIRDARKEHGIVPRLEGHAGHGDDGREPGRVGASAPRPASETSGAGAACGVGNAASAGLSLGASRAIHARGKIERSERPGYAHNNPRYWDAFEIAHCTDGKARRIPTEPSFFPLAHGIPGRSYLLHGAGNAIVHQLAATFIKEADAIIRGGW